METIQGKELNYINEDRHGSCLTCGGKNVEEQQLWGDLRLTSMTNLSHGQDDNTMQNLQTFMKAKPGIGFYRYDQVVTHRGKENIEEKKSTGVIPSRESKSICNRQRQLTLGPTERAIQHWGHYSDTTPHKKVLAVSLALWRHIQIHSCQEKVGMEKGKQCLHWPNQPFWLHFPYIRRDFTLELNIFP